MDWTKREQALRTALEDVLKWVRSAEAGSSDPVWLLWRFPNRRDREIMGWIAASLAYGRRDLFSAVLKRLMQIMGNRPYLFVKNFNFTNDSRIFEGICYRFNTGSDIAILVEVIHQIFLEYDNFETYFLSFNTRSVNEDNVLPLVRGVLSDMRRRMAEVIHSALIDKVMGDPYFLLPDPAEKSPLKRVFMFLRWMVRSDWPDLGAWKTVAPAKLVMPLDVHVFRLCQSLGLTKRHNPSLTAALEITAAFRRLVPTDPLRYDFALSALGAKQCPPAGQPGPCAGLPECPLIHFCQRAKN